MSSSESWRDRPDGYDDGDSAVTDLERRYTRWMKLFYPAGYQRMRGSELVGTYLSLTAPGRKRPSVGDVLDLAAGGLRQHARVADGLGPGFRLAGLLALTTTTVLATEWAALEVLAPTVPRSSHVEPFLSLAVAAWVAWLLAAAVHVTASGRWLRWTIGPAVLVTAGVVPVAALTGLPRPPLSVLLPQIVLGLVALGAAGRHPWWVRLTPIGAAAATLPVATGTVTSPNVFNSYYSLAAAALPAAAVTLLIGAVLLALGLAVRRDYRGAWAMLILLTPIGMLAVYPLSAALGNTGPGRPLIPAWSSMVAVSVLAAVIGPTLVLLALAARARFSPGRRPPGTESDPCSTCGAPPTSA